MIVVTKDKNTVSIDNKQTLADQIYQDIKDDINSKQFQPGDKLNIKELSKKYNVSTTPVKQALQRLVDDKVAVNIPNKGVSVRTFTPQDLHEVFDIRLMMDTFFAKDVLLTLKYNQDLRQQFIKNLEAQRKFVENNESLQNPDEYFALDLEFHTLFLTASGNQKVVDIFRGLQPFTYTAGNYIKQPHERDLECVEEHQAILDAILASDLDTLQKALVTHLNNSKKAIQLIYNVNNVILGNNK